MNPIQSGLDNPHCDRSTAELPKRIGVIGCGGSGKSTLSLELGRILDIEVFHLDSLYWKSDWASPSRDRWREIQTDLVERDSWIIDGHFVADTDITFARAGLVVFLDYPTYVCLLRTLRRRLKRRRRRVYGESECKSRLRLGFLRRIARFRRCERPVVIERLNAHFYGQVVVLRHPKDADRFLSQVRRLRNKASLPQAVSLSSR